MFCQLVPLSLVSKAAHTMPHYHGPNKDPLMYSHTASDCPSSLGVPLAPQGEVRLGRVKGISWGKPTPSPHPRKMSKSSSSLLLCCCWGCKSIQPLWKKIWSFLKKQRVTIWSSNPWTYICTPGHIFVENSNLKGYMHLSVHSSTICISQDIETT